MKIDGSWFLGKSIPEQKQELYQQHLIYTFFPSTE